MENIAQNGLDLNTHVCFIPYEYYYESQEELLCHIENNQVKLSLNEDPNHIKLNLKEPSHNFNINSELNENNDDYDRIEESNGYRLMLEILETHLKNKNHPLSAMIKIFIKCFKQKYYYLFDDLHKMDNKNIEKKLEEIIKDLNIFISFIKNTLFVFYSFEKLPRIDWSLKKYLNSDNLIFFITSILTDFNSIYILIFEMQRYLDFENEKILNSKYKNYLNKDPLFFGVEYKFLNENPFINSIEIFQKIQFINSISVKLHILMHASQKLFEEINLLDKTNTGDNFLINDLNSDELIPIFVYLINKTSIPSILTHCNLIERFLNPNLLSSIIGYYLTTIKASIFVLCDNNFQD